MTAFLFGPLTLHLAMFMQLLASLDRVESLGHQSRHP